MGEASSSLHSQRSKRAQPHKPEIIITLEALQGPVLGQHQKEKFPVSFSIKGEERGCTLGTVKPYTMFLYNHFSLWFHNKHLAKQTHHPIQGHKRSSNEDKTKTLNLFLPLLTAAHPIPTRAQSLQEQRRQSVSWQSVTFC